jgi:hypothetical protein
MATDYKATKRRLDNKKELKGIEGPRLSVRAKGCVEAPRSRTRQRAKDPPVVKFEVDNAALPGL